MIISRVDDDNSLLRNYLNLDSNSGGGPLKGFCEQYEPTRILVQEDPDESVEVGSQQAEHTKVPMKERESYFNAYLHKIG